MPLEILELFLPLPSLKLPLQSQVDTALFAIQYTSISVYEKSSLTGRRFSEVYGCPSCSQSRILTGFLDIAYSLHGAEYLKLSLSACSPWLADASEKRQKNQSALGP